jgi:hypothetical protein
MTLFGDKPTELVNFTNRLKRLKKSAPQKHDYLVRTLAQHLYEARDDNRLNSLFDWADWMQLRVGENNHTYQSYITDLNLAWERLAEHSSIRANTESITEQLATAFRFALIRTTINTLADSYFVDAVVQAIRNQLPGWTVERALAIADLFQSAEDRLRFYMVFLLEDLIDASKQRDFLSILLELIQQVKTPNLKADALTAMLLHLSSPLSDEERLDMAAQARAAIDALPSKTERAIKLAQLESYVSQTDREIVRNEALAEIATIGEETVKIQTLIALSQCWSEAEQKETLEQLLSSQGVSKRTTYTRGMLALAPHLPSQLIVEAFEDAKQHQNEAFFVMAIEEIAPYLPSSVFTDALDILQSMQAEHAQVTALKAVVPYLPAELVGKAKEILGKIQHLEDRIPIYELLLLRASEHERASLLTEALQTARQIDNAVSRASALATLSRIIPDASERREVVSEALTTSLGDDSSEIIETLGMLYPLADAKVRESLLETLLKLAQSLSNPFARASALLAIGGHLSAPRRTDILIDVLNLVARLKDQREISLLLLRFVKVADDDLRLRSLDLATRLPDQGLLMLTVGGYLPYLPEPKRSSIAEKLFRVAGDLAEQWRDEEKYFKEAAGEPFKDKLSEIIDESRLVGVGYQPFKARVLGLLSPYVPQRMQKKAFAQALKAIDEIEDDAERASALGSPLIPHLSSKQLFHVLRTAASIDGNARVLAVALLAPYLRSEHREAVFKVAQSIPFPAGRAYAVASLLHLLPDVDFEHWTSELLLMSEQFSPRYRGAVLAILLRHVKVSAELVHKIQVALIAHLQSNQNATREEVMDIISDEVFLHPLIFSDEVSISLSRHLIEIGFEWKWL